MAGRKRGRPKIRLIRHLHEGAGTSVEVEIIVGGETKLNCFPEENRVPNDILVASGAG